MVGQIKKELTVQTSTNSDQLCATPGPANPKDKYTAMAADTPRTEASTPQSYSDIDGEDDMALNVHVRADNDLRSPGISTTPTAAGTAGAQESAHATPVPVPDFMTQTDKYGNPIVHNHAVPAPLQMSGIQSTDTDETENETELEVDACDTLLESIRMMCCCILPDPHGSDANGDKKASGSGGGSRLRSSHNPGHNSANSTNSYHQNNNNMHPHPQSYSNNPNYSPSRSSSYGSPPQISHKYVNGGSTAVHPTKQIMKEDSDMGGIKLLKEIDANQDSGKKCLVLDLDETLVHSSFRAVPGADFVIPVQIDDVVHFVYVMKRPGVDDFLVEMAKHYEIVIYTASLNKYADPLLDLLDTKKTIRYRLFRESCVYYEGSYVKDLSLLNRDLTQAIIVDNSPASYIFHPENAIDCSSFIDDPADRELHQIGSFLTGVRNIKDVRRVCNMWRDWPRIPRIDFVEYPEGYDPVRDAEVAANAHHLRLSLNEFSSESDDRHEAEPLQA